MGFDISQAIFVLETAQVIIASDTEKEAEVFTKPAGGIIIPACFSSIGGEPSLNLLDRASAIYTASIISGGAIPTPRD